jgi:hypothetical protein
MWLARIKSGLWSVVVGAATLLFLLEEWLWDTLRDLMMSLGRLPGIRALERWISGLPPGGAALFFVLPTSLALPVKLVALHQIAHGHVLRGTLVIVAAKILATALFARIYVLTEPALMRVAWFVQLRELVLRWRHWAYAQIESHPLWRRIRTGVLQWRAGHAGRWGRRRRALQRWWRMRHRRSPPPSHPG